MTPAIPPEGGGPAFPSDFSSGDPRGGMTLRDYFAGQTLPAIFTGTITAILQGAPTMEPSLIASDCYKMADAMLAERAKKTPTTKE